MTTEAMTAERIENLRAYLAKWATKPEETGISRVEIATHQVSDLLDALAASEQRATMTTDAGLREARENLVREWRFVIEREDQWRGFDDPEWKRLWASVRESLATLDAALAPAAQRASASAGPGDAKAGDDQ